MICSPTIVLVAEESRYRDIDLCAFGSLSLSSDVAETITVPTHKEPFDAFCATDSSIQYENYKTFGWRLRITFQVTPSYWHPEMLVFAG